MKHCINCQAELSDEMKFCTECGAPQEVAEAQPEALQAEAVDVASELDAEVAGEIPQGTPQEPVDAEAEAQSEALQEEAPADAQYFNQSSGQQSGGYQYQGGQQSGGYQYQSGQQSGGYQYQNGQQYSSATKDNGGFGWGLLGFCVPIVGLILFLVWRDEKPRTGKAAGIGALISVGIGVLFYIVVFIIGVTGAVLYN